jgi:hypothetical protein
MDLSSKIMIGYCIMAVGGLFFIITLLSIIILSNEPELKNLINGVIFLIIFIFIIMFGYSYKTKNQELLNIEKEKVESIEKKLN